MQRIIAALVLATLAGCGPNDAQPATAPATTTTTTTATATNTPGPSYAKADLDAALLTLADLTPGYKPDTQTSPDSVTSSCTEEAIALESYRQVAPAKTGTAFSNTAGQLVVQSLILLSDDAETHTLAALRQSVARCTTWTVNSMTFTMSKADYGPYGDETVGYRVTVKGEIPFVEDIVFVRKANLLMGVMVATHGGSPPKGARAVIDAAARKLPNR